MYSTFKYLIGYSSSDLCTTLSKSIWKIASSKFQHFKYLVLDFAKQIIKLVSKCQKYLQSTEVVCLRTYMITDALKVFEVFSKYLEYVF